MKAKVLAVQCDVRKPEEVDEVLKKSTRNFWSGEWFTE
jgi:hypothetical protein